MKKYVSEFLGTLLLVLFGTGVATISGGNIIATSIAFGLVIIMDIYIFGNISGSHVNPAVSLAMLITKRLSLKDFIWYVTSQLIGAIIGTTILYAILSGTELGTANLGANYYGKLSQTNISLFSAILTESILTLGFVYTILKVTSDKNKTSISGIIIGFSLILVHLFGIPLTGTSVNPARSISAAIYTGGDALKQLWVFIIAPLLGGVGAAYLYKYFAEDREEKPKTKTKKKSIK